MSLRPTLGLCIGVLAASFAVTGCVSEWHVGDDGYDEEGLPPCDEPPPPEDGCDSCSGCGSCDPSWLHSDSATSTWRGWTGAVRLRRPRDPSWLHSDL
jgi:hypothetical protein